MRRSRFTAIQGLLAGVFLLAGASTASAQSEAGPRRVGLALSGGAARGFAHIGVIEVLEEHGLHVDIVTGTSMGSVVGGLYAIGYTPEMLRRVSSEVSWARLFSDQPDRRNLPIERKLNQGRLLFVLPLDGVIPTLPSSLIEGQGISQLLTDLTWPAHSVTDFTKLSKPFGAVATAADSGSAVPLRSGYLPEAMRASLAIPGVFAPVEIDGRLLIDGGIARNLPAQDAAELGADWIICSDVSEPLAPQDSLRNLAAILNQTVAFRMWERTLDQRERCDVLIVTSMPRSLSTGFERAAEIIEIGRTSAERALDSLRSAGLALAPPAAFRPRRDSTWIPEAERVRLEAIRVRGVDDRSRGTLLRTLQLDTGRIVTPPEVDRAISRVYATGLYRTVWYRLERSPSGPRSVTDRELSVQDVPDVVLDVEVGDRRRNRLGASYRYDSRYKASILATTEFRDLLVPGSLLRGDLRLGEQGRIAVDFGKRWGWSVAPMLAVRFQSEQTPFDIYVDGERVSSPVVQSTSGRGLAGFGFGYDGFAGVELGFEAVSSDPAPLAEDWVDGTREFGTVAGVAVVDRWDRAKFPRSGGKLFAKALWAENTGGNGDFSFYVFDLKGIVPVTDRVGILGRATLGTTSGDDLPPNYLFFVGGAEQYELYADRHFPFDGLRVDERRGRHLQAGMLGVQWEFLPELFLQARGNVAGLPDEWAWDEDALFGGWGLTLGAWTRFGSAALTLAGRTLSKWPSVTIDVGFPF